MRDDQVLDRHLQCQEALEVGFQELVNHGVGDGWSEREALLALIDLAHNQFLAIEANAQTDEEIGKAKGRG